MIDRVTRTVWCDLCGASNAQGATVLESNNWQHPIQHICESCVAATRDRPEYNIHKLLRDAGYRGHNAQRDYTNHEEWVTCICGNSEPARMFGCSYSQDYGETPEDDSAVPPLGWWAIVAPHEKPGRVAFTFACSFECMTKTRTKLGLRNEPKAK